jgi:MFS family permease
MSGSSLAVGRPSSALAGLMAACLSVFLPLGALLPVLPLYLRNELDAGAFTIGFLIAGMGFVAVLFRPFAGSLTDRIGRRHVAVAGALVCSLSGCLYFVPGLGGVAAARFALGIGEALATSATMAWAIDLAPAAQRGRTLALFGLAIWIGLSIGPLIGVALHTIGYGAVWVFVALTPLAGALLATVLPGGDFEGKGRPAPEGRRIIPRGVVTPGIAGALVSIGAGVVEAFVVLHVAERGLAGGSAARVGGLVYATFAAAGVLTRVLGGGVVDRFGAIRIAAVSCIVEAAGLALVAGAWNRPILFLGAACIGAALALLFPSLAVIAVGAAPESSRGAAAATFTAFFDTGFAVGGLVGGIIASFGSYADAFWVSSLCALACMSVVAALRRRPGLGPEATLAEQGQQRL